MGSFLVLTEAIAGIVAATSTLNCLTQFLLVIFIVQFPFAVLAVFYILVTEHHEKLYSPSEFKDEKLMFGLRYDSQTQKKIIAPIVDGCNDTLNEDNDVATIKETLADVVKIQEQIISHMNESEMSGEQKERIIGQIQDNLEMMDDNEQDYRVEIAPLYQRSRLVEILQEKGYNAGAYLLTNSVKYGNRKYLKNEECEAIWLGNRVPLRVAKEVIKVAKDFYPHLKYIKLSDGKNGAPNYVRYQIFIGGATATAKNRGLKPLTKDEFTPIYDMESLEDLHKYIRQFG